MECSEIKTHLSAHLDSALDARTDKILEAHLAGCNACRQTKATLQSVVREVSVLESAKAPDDFLEQLHARLDSSFALRNQMRKLFSPLHIKLPLQLATATALGFIIFFMVQTQEPLISSKYDIANAPAIKYKQILRQDAPVEAPSKLRERRAVPEVASEPQPPSSRHWDKEETEIEEKFEAEKPTQMKALQVREQRITGAQVKSLPKSIKPEDVSAKKKPAPAIVSPDTVIELALVLNPKISAIEKRSVSVPFHKMKPKKYMIKPVLGARSPKLTSEDKYARQSYGIMPETGELNDTAHYEKEPLKKETVALPRKKGTPVIDTDQATLRKTAKTSEPKVQASTSEGASVRAKNALKTKHAIRQPVLRDTQKQSKLSENHIEPGIVASQAALAKIINLSKRLQGKVLDVSYHQKTGLPSTITAAIPANRCRFFFRQLMTIGHFKSPPKIDSKDNQSLIKFRIRFM